MTIYSYISRTVEQGGWTGVCRFSNLLKRALPTVIELTKLPELKPEDIVVTDNHFSLDVPANIRTVIVHHGCALTHYERDAAWRTPQNLRMMNAQRIMFERKDAAWVAPSLWVALEFHRQCQLNGQYKPYVIPHWVDSIPSLPKSGKPKIIGDWRDNNKGSGIWRALAERCPQWEFQPLNFRTDEGRRKQYGEASLYLCLSLSEGGPYAVCDAEAAELPIITTDVGNYLEFKDCEVISWRNRGNPEIVIEAIGRKLSMGRGKPSYYQEYTFDRWAGLWREISEVL